MAATGELANPAELLPPHTLRGVSSRLQTEWEGVPLQGMCLVENRLETPRDNTLAKLPPVVLVSAVFDPVRGEYSGRLIKMLLQEKGFDRVYETHYLYGGSIGRMEPTCVTQDLVTICSVGTAQPLLVSLCGGVLCLMEALLAIDRDELREKISGVLFIGPILMGQLNLRGWLVYQLLTHPIGPGQKKTVEYTGHTHLSENLRRLSVAYRSSKIRSVFEDALFRDQYVSPFPVPTGVLYFDRDFLSRRGRQRLAQVFSAKELPERIPGVHGNLHRSARGDKMVAAFCRSIVDGTLPTVENSPTS